jgi:hypothetical protein
MNDTNETKKVVNLGPIPSNIPIGKGNQPTIEAWKKANFCRIWVLHERLVGDIEYFHRHGAQLSKIEQQKFYKMAARDESALRPLSNIRDSNLQDCVMARGGQTTVEIELANGKKYKHTSRCSVKDIFCRRVGIMKALYHIWAQIEKDQKGIS